MLEREMGLYLRLRVERGLVAVEAAARIPRWSRALLHAPILTRETYTEIAFPGVETVMSLLDEKGGVIDSFGFSELPKVFFDRMAPGRRGRLKGNTGDPRQRLREIRVPLPGAARFLNFHRSELRFVKRGAVSAPELRQQHVALYSTARPGERTLPTPPLPVPPIVRVRPLPLPWLPAPGERRRG